MPDIDIDFADRNKVLEIIEQVPASIKDSNGVFKKHNTGVYCHKIPLNPLTGAASIDYKLAEDRGYFKIDFLNVSIYHEVKDENHLTRLLEKEPLWDLLLEAEFVDRLFHLNGHHAVLQSTRPKSISQLAMVLAMIRPAKRYLIGKTWADIEQEIWVKPTGDEYYFKKSHAHAYAAAIVVQMNLICENLIDE